MGNAAITIHHPTSLKADTPYLEAGKIIDSTGSLIRVEKRDGAAVGCGGVFIFKKNVHESTYTYQITKSNSQSFETSVTAASKEKGRVNQKFKKEDRLKY